MRVWLCLVCLVAAQASLSASPAKKISFWDGRFLRAVSDVTLNKSSCELGFRKSVFHWSEYRIPLRVVTWVVDWKSETEPSELRVTCTAAAKDCVLVRRYGGHTTGIPHEVLPPRSSQVREIKLLAPAMNESAAKLLQTRLAAMKKSCS